MPTSAYRHPKMDKALEIPRWPGSQDQVDNEHHRLRVQLGFADRLLGALLYELRRLRIYDESLVIVCADHGSSFVLGEPRRLPTPATFGDVAFVPLLIKYPNQKGPERNLENVEVIDILPTIRDVLGADLDWDFDGRSLINRAEQPRPVKRLPADRGQTDKYDYTETEYSQARKNAHSRIVKTFSLEDPRSDIFRYGPGLEFVGQDASAISSITMDGSIESPDIARLSRLDSRAADYYPRVVGTIRYSGADGAELHVAVIMNGRIELIVPVYPTDSSLGFEAILPEHRLAPGINDFEFALVKLRNLTAK